MVRSKDKSNSLNELDSFLAYKLLKSSSRYSYSSIAKGILLLLLSLGLAISDFIIWPYIGYGIAILNLWAIATLWLIFTKPKITVQYWNAVLGSLFLTIPIIGVLEIYQQGTGGQFGEILFENSFKLGITFCLILAIFSVYLIIPRRLTSICIKFAHWMLWFYSKSLPVVVRLYLTTKLVAKYSFQACKQIYAISYRIASALYKNYPKFPVHKTITMPIQFFIGKIKNRNLNNPQVTHDQYNKPSELQQINTLEPDVIEDNYINDDSNLIDHDEFEHLSNSSYSDNDNEHLVDTDSYLEDILDTKVKTIYFS